LSDGRILDGGLYVDYHETVSPFLAKRLAMEYYQKDKREKNYEALKAPNLSVDFVVAYNNNVHFPTIVIQEGNKVVHVSFYQTSSNYTMELEEWSSIVAESIKGN